MACTRADRQQRLGVGRWGLLSGVHRRPARWWWHSGQRQDELVAAWLVGLAVGEGHGVAQAVGAADRFVADRVQILGMVGAVMTGVAGRRDAFVVAGPAVESNRVDAGGGADAQGGVVPAPPQPRGRNGLLALAAAER